MPNNFNDNTNKKGLGWEDVSYTTYRTNYSSDEMMRNNGGMPPSSCGELEDNREVIIDASTYTEPIVVKPSTGKDAMEQVTVNITGLGSGYKMLPINIRCPADNSGNQRSAVIGLSSNEFFTKTTITVEEATEFLQNTYILFYDGSERLYYKTLLAYIRQRMSDEEWTVYSVETDKSSTSSNSIKFFGTQDKTNAKACNLSLYKLNNTVLTEPFDFVQWSS